MIHSSYKSISFHLTNQHPCVPTKYIGLCFGKKKCFHHFLASKGKLIKLFFIFVLKSKFSEVK